MRKKGRDVEVQKGTIMSNPPTMKQMSYKEKVAERERELKAIRTGQFTDLEKPKR